MSISLVTNNGDPYPGSPVVILDPAFFGPAVYNGPVFKVRTNGIAQQNDVVRFTNLPGGVGVDPAENHTYQNQLTYSPIMNGAFFAVNNLPSNPDGSFQAPDIPIAGLVPAEGVYTFTVEVTNTDGTVVRSSATFTMIVPFTVTVANINDDFTYVEVEGQSLDLDRGDLVNRFMSVGPAAIADLNPTNWSYTVLSNNTGLAFSSAPTALHARQFKLSGIANRIGTIRLRLDALDGDSNILRSYYSALNVSVPASLTNMLSYYYHLLLRMSGNHSHPFASDRTHLSIHRNFVVPEHMTL